LSYKSIFDGSRHEDFARIGLLEVFEEWQPYRNFTSHIKTKSGLVTTAHI